MCSCLISLGQLYILLQRRCHTKMLVLKSDMAKLKVLQVSYKMLIMKL